ncbi:putative isoprenylcysteine alpha-carbonyl methylesterase icmel2 [Orobanche hederae]
METSSSLPANLLSRDSINEITEETETDTLVRVSSFPVNQKPRRRVGNKSAPYAARPRRPQSLGREIGHAAAETYLLTRLSFQLLSYLGVGYRWITRLLALALYAMLLMPGFLQGLPVISNALLSNINNKMYSIFSWQLLSAIFFQTKSAEVLLDLYLPTNNDDLKPVVIFVTGGAWIIGYKAWGSFLGLQLAERDIIVACLDYRNFPQGTISDMVNDVCQGIEFVCNNIIEFGGDPTRIYLMGQSAGAHISSCALFQQAIKESRDDSISWSVSQINAYFGLSGGYNLLKLVDHFHNRGLYRSIFLSIMEGEKALEQFSPEIIVQNPNSVSAVRLLPHMVLFHGTADYSIPCDASITFVGTLQKAGAQADLLLYKGKTHTDLFLQDPLRGGKDELFDYLVGFIHTDDEEALGRDAMAPPRRRYVPELLLRWAGQVSPF